MALTFGIVRPILIASTERALTLMDVSDLVQQLTLGVISSLQHSLSFRREFSAGLVQLPALILLGLPFQKHWQPQDRQCCSRPRAASRHFTAGNLCLKLSLLVLLSGLPGVWIGANVALKLPDQWATISLVSSPLDLVSTPPSDPILVPVT